MRYALGVIIGVALLSAAALRSLPDRRVEPTQLLVNVQMMERLEQVAQEDSLEDARCIAGTTFGEDSVKLEAAFETPWLLKAHSDTGAYFRWDLCPSGTLAWWHSHPWLVVKRLAKENRISPEAFCDLSEVDMIGRRLPFAIISVRRGLSCFFWQKTDGTYARIPLERDSL